jgi:hypothetical protein
MFRFKEPSKRSWWHLSGLLTALFLFLSIAINGQDITSGTIQGVVTDEQGAVVGGATVEARNVATNFSRTFTTDADGRFSFLSVPSGRYVVSVTKQGFAKLNQENVDVTVGKVVALNLGLKVSGVSGEVTITTTPTIDTVKTESSTTLNQAAIENTPILGRKFEDLLTLTPGVAITQGPDGDEINFAGQRGIFNNVSLDGGDYNNGFFGEQAGGQRAAIDITLDAVKEFQVIATGANAEYGRTAGGVINVITKSGTNDVHGSAFYYLRHKSLTSNTSDGKELQDFRRHQFGGTIGGPIIKDKAFYFFAVEGIRENLLRPNLSEQIGSTACPVSTPTIGANEPIIISNPDCQRLALLNFFQSTRNSNEGLPVIKKIDNLAFLSKLDWDVNSSNKFSASYNFDHSKNTNQTFDVPTYGTSANGTEGPSKINVFNANLYTTLSPTKLNEFHFTYSREARPRRATDSNIPADTGIGFAPSFRFGNPFFLQPNVDELFWRAQFKDNFSIISGKHTFKFGGDWMHSVNTQVFRGFFLSRYIFGSVNGFLRYASPAAANGFGPGAEQCPNGSWVTTTAPFNQSCAGSSTPLLLYLQAAGPSGPATDAAGASSIKNEELALFAQDRFQVASNFTLNYGLRWEAQIFPDPTVPPSSTAYGIFLGRSDFPSDGTIPNDKKMWQPRVGFAWDIAKNGKSVVRASFGIFAAHQNMLSQVSAITTNGVQQQTIVNAHPVWPGLATPSAGTCDDGPGGLPVNPFPCFSGVHVFDRNYQNPRIYTTNVAYEQEIAPDWALYFDFIYSKGRHLTRFLNIGGRTFIYTPYLFDAWFHTAIGRSAYYGFTSGIRKRFSNRLQMEANYVWSRDKDDDSNERDPFTDRSFDPTRPQLDYSLSDRDVTHKFNLFAFIELPWKLEFTPRVQARSAQPATPPTLALISATQTNRNTLRKDNEYFSFDWRLGRVFKLGEKAELIPQIDMFNSFNNKNYVNSLSIPGNQFSITAANLFDFSGFLRQGVGDPRQVQLSIRLRF